MRKEELRKKKKTRLCDQTDHESEKLAVVLRNNLDLPTCVHHTNHHNQPTNTPTTTTTPTTIPSIRRNTTTKVNSKYSFKNKTKTKRKEHV
jgi:hypothetical protein